MAEELKVQIQKIAGHDDIPLPRYMTEQSAGMDIFAAVEAEIIILPGERKLIPTGIVIAVPEGYEAEIRPRSGLAMKHGVTLMNAPGTIDADYRGEIGIIMVNHGEKPFLVKRGDRIAQMLIRRICKVIWDDTGKINMTVRGLGGFGHTK